MTAGSPLGGAVAPGGGGGGGGVVTMTGDVTGDSDDNTISYIQDVPVDFDGGIPAAGRVLVTEDVGGTVRIKTQERDIRVVYYDEGNIDALQPVYNTFPDAFTAAENLLALHAGPVQIVALNDNDPPEFPSGTFDAQGLIEVVGKTTVREDRVTVDLQSGFVLKNARALRNLYIEHDIAAPWLTTSTATDLNLVLDNTYLYVNGSSADICTLAASTIANRVQLVNGSRIEGDSGKFATLVSGKAITAFVDSGVLNGEVFGGSAGSVQINQGPDGSVEPQASFSGTIAYTSAVVTALGQTTSAVGFNGQEVTSVATPTTGTSATNRNWVDGAQSVSVAGTGSVSLSSGNVAYGSLQLTGALTGDRTVTLPSGTRGLWVRNGTSGLYTLRLQGPSGGFCYLLPGQARRVYVDGSGILRGDALYLCETEIDVSIIGIGSGDNTTSLCRLPAKFALERVERMTITAPDGDGEYNDSVGFTGSTYDDILANNPYPFADTWGLASAEWGSGFADGYSYDASARTLVYLINGFNQTVSNTVGSVRVRIAGRYFGS